MLAALAALSSPGSAFASAGALARQNQRMMSTCCRRSCCSKAHLTKPGCVRHRSSASAKRNASSLAAASRGRKATEAVRIHELTYIPRLLQGFVQTSPNAWLLPLHKHKDALPKAPTPNLDLAQNPAASYILKKQCPRTLAPCSAPVTSSGHT